jgi:hypothetical protein
LVRDRRWITVTCLLLALGCRSGGGHPAPLRDAETLAEWLEGSFDSLEQHQAAPDDFFDIQLHHVRIWEKRGDGPWLYVEQALAMSADKPYRQRVYRLKQLGPGEVENEVFALPGDPLVYAGAWREPERLSSLTPEQLTLRPGCSVFLSRAGDAYVGGTRGEVCEDASRRAAYITSEVTLTRDVLSTLDRGFSSSGEQVWGSTAGPYHFRRMTRTVPPDQSPDREGAGSSVGQASLPAYSNPDRKGGAGASDEATKRRSDEGAFRGIDRDT